MRVNIRKACAPIGSLIQPPDSDHYCRCGERLVASRCPDRNDWRHLTADGEAVRDDRPPALSADPDKWWDDLARNDIHAYSSLRAATDLGQLAWFHHHLPDSAATGRLAPDRQPVEVPFCCNQPMWASPDGWACRVSGDLFRYTAAS